MKPAKNKSKVVFVTTAFVFVGNVVQSLSFLPLVWCIAAFASYIPAVIMNANLTAIMREHIPLEMQGRVFSAKDTLQNCTIPLGLFFRRYIGRSCHRTVCDNRFAYAKDTFSFFWFGKRIRNSCYVL